MEEVFDRIKSVGGIAAEEQRQKITAFRLENKLDEQVKEERQRKKILETKINKEFRQFFSQVFEIDWVPLGGVPRDVKGWYGQADVLMRTPEKIQQGIDLIENIRFDQIKDASSQQVLLGSIRKAFSKEGVIRTLERLKGQTEDMLNNLPIPAPSKLTIPRLRIGQEGGGVKVQADFDPMGAEN